MNSRKKRITDAALAIGERIRDARKRLDVSVTELGVAFGGTRQKVQFWERGENFPPLSEFPKLCQMLRTDANTLLGMGEMKPLNEQEKTAAKLDIQTMAAWAKASKRGTGRRRVSPDRLQRRPGSPPGIRR